MPKLDHTAGNDLRETRLQENLIVWLGTVRPDGRPHLVPVWFQWDGETALILSQPPTQKVRNLQGNNRVTLALDDTRGGVDIIILEGTASLLSKKPSRERLDAYLAKYRNLMDEMEWAPEAYLADYAQAIIVRPQRFLSW